MSDIQCLKCEQPTEKITEPLFLGKLEEEVKNNVCQNCWTEWNKPGGVKTMVINEYHLNLGDENGRATLKKHMRAFFKLPDSEVEFKDYRT